MRIEDRNNPRGTKIKIRQWIGGLPGLGFLRAAALRVKRNDVL